MTPVARILSSDRQCGPRKNSPTHDADAGLRQEGRTGGLRLSRCTRKDENTLVCLHQWFVSAVKLTLCRSLFFETCAHPRDLSVATGFWCQNMNTSAILVHRVGWNFTR